MDVGIRTLSDTITKEKGNISDGIGGPKTNNQWDQKNKFIVNVLQFYKGSLFRCYYNIKHNIKDGDMLDDHKNEIIRLLRKDINIKDEVSFLDRNFIEIENGTTIRFVNNIYMIYIAIEN